MLLLVTIFCLAIFWEVVLRPWVVDSLPLILLCWPSCLAGSLLLFDLLATPYVALSKFVVLLTALAMTEMIAPFPSLGSYVP